MTILPVGGICLFVCNQGACVILRMESIGNKVFTITIYNSIVNNSLALQNKCYGTISLAKV